MCGVLSSLQALSKGSWLTPDEFTMSRGSGLVVNYPASHPLIHLCHKHLLRRYLSRLALGSRNVAIDRRDNFDPHTACAPIVLKNGPKIDSLTPSPLSICSSLNYSFHLSQKQTPKSESPGKH